MSNSNKEDELGKFLDTSTKAERKIPIFFPLTIRERDSSFGIGVMHDKNLRKRKRKVVKEREKNSSKPYGTPRTRPDCPPKFLLIKNEKSRENKQGRRREKRSETPGRSRERRKAIRLDTPLTRVASGATATCGARAGD